MYRMLYSVCTLLYYTVHQCRMLYTVIYCTSVQNAVHCYVLYISVKCCTLLCTVHQCRMMYIGIYCTSVQNAVHCSTLYISTDCSALHCTVLFEKESTVLSVVYAPYRHWTWNACSVRTCVMQFLLFKSVTSQFYSKQSPPPKLFNFQSSEQYAIYIYIHLYILIIISYNEYESNDNRCD